MISLASHMHAMKARSEKVAMLTAYDYPTARLLEESGVDVLLVGDSLGMVVLGFPDTTHVTLDHMAHHTRAVARGRSTSHVLADLPYATYCTPQTAVASAKVLIDAGADAVKLEGGRSHVPQIEALAAAGIPVMAHIGMMPQSVLTEGGYRIKGKTQEEADRLLEDAAAVQKAGAFGLLLELVVPAVTAQITRSSAIPTIGIGSGPDCDGQVLVTHDLIGMFPWFTPRFVRPQAQTASEIKRAATLYVSQTKTSRGSAE